MTSYRRAQPGLGLWLLVDMCLTLGSDIITQGTLPSRTLRWPGFCVKERGGDSSVNTRLSRPLDIVLTSDRKLSKGRVGLRGAAPEKGRTNTQEMEPRGERERERKSFCAL